MEEFILEELRKDHKRLQKMNQEYMGYPLAKDFSYQSLAPFLDLQMNNVGDPYTPSTLGIDTKKKEKEVLSFFKKLLRAQEEETWGYVTNGGSEGNLYGLYLAREMFPNGMVYYSESTHYSVKKNLHLLNIPNIVIRSQENGEMDYDDLDQTLATKRERPAIFFLNVGTTMQEAIDRLQEIKKLIRKYALKDVYIHVDAALAGVMAPFYEEEVLFDFADGIDSISISGHKFIGSPIPCGVVLCRKEHSERVSRSISYVGTKDTTITGSRNGLTPLILWVALKKMGVEGLRKRYQNSLELANYALQSLQEINWVSWKNTYGITVVLERPSSGICEKHQLAVEDEIAHIICVPGLAKEQIDDLIRDLAEEKVVLPTEQHIENSKLHQTLSFTW